MNVSLFLHQTPPQIFQFQSSTSIQSSIKTRKISFFNFIVWLKSLPLIGSDWNFHRMFSSYQRIISVNKLVLKVPDRKSSQTRAFCISEQHIKAFFSGTKLPIATCRIYSCSGDHALQFESCPSKFYEKNFLIKFSLIFSLF